MTAAPDQIKSIVERFAASIEAHAARLSYCVARVEPIATREQWTPDGRTTDMAARIIGAGREQTNFLLTKARRNGAEVAARLHIDKADVFPDYKVGPLDKSVIGFVYHARSPRFPHVVKIGFSTDPAKRIKRVAAIYGEPIALESAEVGTKLDEYQELKSRWRDNCAHEWFFDPAMGRSDIPHFLLADNIAVKSEGRRKHVAHRQEVLACLREGRSLA